MCLSKRKYNKSTCEHVHNQACSVKDVNVTYMCRLCVSEFVHGIDTDKVNVYIEDCTAKQEPLIKVLRLLCIQSCCNNGFKPKVLDYYKREIIQVSNSDYYFIVRTVCAQTTECLGDDYR